MRIDFPGLQAFLSIAEQGSFSRAAAHLNLSQTALSHRIKKLEEDLGFQLLARTTRQVALTPAGLELLPTARRMIGEFSELHRSAAGTGPQAAGAHRARLPADHRRLSPAAGAEAVQCGASGDFDQDPR